MHGNKDPTVGG